MNSPFIKKQIAGTRKSLRYLDTARKYRARVLFSGSVALRLHAHTKQMATQNI